MSWIVSCDTFEDDGLRWVKRAYFHEAQRGTEHHKDPLNLGIIIIEAPSIVLVEIRSDLISSAIVRVPFAHGKGFDCVLQVSSC